MIGFQSGNRSTTRRWGIALFMRDDGGYTTIAIAVALLVSLTLVFGTAAASWTASRAADVQEVADASALAGANVVAGFTTIAQVTDACTLSLGLAGLTTLGAGLVLSAIPGAQEGAVKTIDAAQRILDMRRDFAHSAAEGMQRLEQVLPAVVMANAASCVAANSTERTQYTGCAVPFPLTSETDYSFLEDELDGGNLAENARKLQEAAERKREAIEQANNAKERAWRADCVDDPLCMRSRAASLAGLSGTFNPNYTSYADWLFGYAQSRSVNYYRARLSAEHSNGSIEEITRSAARRQFYEYAAQVIKDATCNEEGEVPDIHLPELPHNTSEMRQTSLYTDSVWPCTNEEEGRTLHSSHACPGTNGAWSGYASLAQLDAGAVRECPTCEMNSVAQGRAASASTNINNGYEHYWRIVVYASREYVAAKEAEAIAEHDLEDISQESESLFDQAIKMLSVNRPDIKPAGMWGCVAVVGRSAGTITPSELTQAFSTGAELPAGMAIAGATLAPEATTDGSTVLSQLFSGIVARTDFGPLRLVDGVCELWGKLLVGYGSAYEHMSSAANGFLDNLGGFLGEKVATKIRSRISEIITTTGLEPTDMRARKPVLVHSQLILDQAGEGREALGVAREILAKLPSDGQGAARVLVSEVVSRVGNGGVLTVATLKVPGTQVEIPLTVDLNRLVGAL